MACLDCYAKAMQERDLIKLSENDQHLLGIQWGSEDSKAYEQA